MEAETLLAQVVARAHQLPGVGRGSSPVQGRGAEGAEEGRGEYTCPCSHGFSTFHRGDENLVSVYQVPLRQFKPGSIFFGGNRVLGMNCVLVVWAVQAV